MVRRIRSRLIHLVDQLYNYFLDPSIIGHCSHKEIIFGMVFEMIFRMIFRMIFEIVIYSFGIDQETELW